PYPTPFPYTTLFRSLPVAAPVRQKSPIGAPEVSAGESIRRTPNPCREAVRREPRRPLPEPLAGSSLTAPPVAASSASPHSYSAERRRAGQGIRKVQFLPGAPPHVACRPWLLR